MKLRKRSLAIATSLSSALILAVAGCATAQNNAAGNNSSTGAASTTAIQKGGTAVVPLVAANITWYFPIESVSGAQAQNSQLISQLYPGLIYIDSQYNVDYKDGFASSINANKAGNVFTINLKKNWKWSDGTPVTADDVVWDYQLIQASDSKNAPAPWPNYNAGSGGIPTNVKSVVAKGKYQVVISLKKPVNQQWFIYNGIEQLAPLPKHVWDKYPTNMKQELTYLGKNATNWKFDSVVDGPFKLEKAVSNQEWDLVPNPYFGGHKSVLNKLVIQYEASAASELAALRAGTLDMGGLDPSELGAEPALKAMGDTIDTAYNFGYYYVTLNMQKGSPLYSAFNDLKVRQALDMGIDQQTIHSDIDHGYDTPQYGPIPPLPKTSFTDPKLNKPVYPFNIQKGKQLLESDGWKLNSQGIMEKNGQELKFTMLYYNGGESLTQQAELIQQDWKQMGVDIQIKPMTFSDLDGISTNTSQPGKWAATYGTGITYGGSYPSGEQLFEPGGLDTFGYNNAKENALISKTIKPAASKSQSMKDFFAYEEYTAKQLPVLFTNNAAGILVFGSKIHGYGLAQDNVTVSVWPLWNYIWVSQ